MGPPLGPVSWFFLIYKLTIQSQEWATGRKALAQIITSIFRHTKAVRQIGDPGMTALPGSRGGNTGAEGQNAIYEAGGAGVSKVPTLLRRLS
jgi:hypothetical protein